MGVVRWGVSPAGWAGHLRAPSWPNYTQGKSAGGVGYRPGVIPYLQQPYCAHSLSHGTEDTAPPGSLFPAETWAIVRALAFYIYGTVLSKKRPYALRLLLYAAVERQSGLLSAAAWYPVRHWAEQRIR